MFDRTFVLPRRTEYVTREVHEHRAPTDESVALLREMEAAAHKKVTETIRLEDNSFKAVVNIELHMMDDDRVCRCMFNLNGSNRTVESRGPRHESLQESMMRLRDAVSMAIAGEIVNAFSARFDAMRQSVQYSV